MGTRAQHRQYVAFYWPLALTGSIGLSGALIKNFFLLEYPDGVRELAVYALAWSFFMPLQAAMWMVAQAVNVLAVDHASLRQTIRFFALIVGLMTIPLVLLGFTPFGMWALERTFTLDAATLEVVQRYLRWFIPFPLLMTVSQFLHGLMIRVEATGRTTAIEGARALLLILALSIGLQRGASPVATLVIGQVIADGSTILLRARVLWPLRQHWSAGVLTPPPGYRRIALFFIPIAFTTLMFSFGRPVIFSFVTAIPAADLPAGMTVERAVAALNLAWSLMPLLINPLNQIRSVFVNFAREDRAGVVWLLRRTVLLLAATWLVLGLSPLDGWFYRYLQGADADTTAAAETIFLGLCLLPLLLGWRNYYHGLALTYRHTASMGTAALLRLATVYLTCRLLLAGHLLTPATAAMSMLPATVVEALVLALDLRRWRGDLATPERGDLTPEEPP